jgi:hypothetical protein
MAPFQSDRLTRTERAFAREKTKGLLVISGILIPSASTRVHLRHNLSDLSGDGTPVVSLRSTTATHSIRVNPCPSVARSGWAFMPRHSCGVAAQHDSRARDHNNT